jgi:hypothetical protein
MKINPVKTRRKKSSLHVIISYKITESKLKTTEQASIVT